MKSQSGWRERLGRLDRWALRGGFLTSRQDVAEMLAPLVERIDVLEREVEQLRKPGSEDRSGARLNVR